MDVPRQRIIALLWSQPRPHRGPENPGLSPLSLHKKRGWESWNSARHGIRFFYRITLGLPDPHFNVLGAKQPYSMRGNMGNLNCQSVVPMH